MKLFLSIKEIDRRCIMWYRFTNPSAGNRRRALNRWRRRQHDWSRRNKIVAVTSSRDDDTGLHMQKITTVRDGWLVSERVEIMHGVALASRALPLLEL